MHDNPHRDHIHEATSRVRATMSPGVVARAEKMAEINAQYIPTVRDKILNARLDSLFESLVATHNSEMDKKRILIILGESGAGKSRLLDHNFAQREAFQPYVDSYGTVTRPMLRYNAPQPCTPKMLALEGLDKLGYPVEGNLTEAKAWQLFRYQLMVRKTLFVHIDEAQHSVMNRDKDIVQKVSDGFKNLVQMQWPVRLMLSGVSPLEELVLRDKQIKERSLVIQLDNINVERHKKLIQSVLETVIVDHASLDLDDFVTDEFLDRLVHSCGGSFGSIIQMIRTAVRECFVDPDQPDVVRAKHFKSAYQSISGCAPLENLFVRKDWAKLDPGLASLPPVKPGKGSTDGTMGLRYGERP
ncbi:ATP-binding protein [Phyllobacterium sp. LjRoot231]|uniref:ATP-binding protein n=1 Tax=Phyllobacterium sp. LjRoot231 TaxID=3342289 RepID=UPI003ECE24A6